MNEESLYSLLLVIARVSSFFVATPFFSTRSVPNVVKIFIAIIVSLITHLTIPTEQVAPTQMIEFGLMIVREALIGVVVGYSVNIIFLGIQSAGDFIDLFAGLQMSSTYDPVTGTNGTFYSNIYNWIAILMFLNMEGHHYLITGIVNSFIYIPIGETALIEIDINTIAMLLVKTFYLSLQLAFPIAIILFLIDIILGTISRVVPQINVFILGMPVKLALSAFMIYLITSGILNGISWAIDIVIEMLNTMIKSIT